MKAILILMTTLFAGVSNCFAGESVEVSCMTFSFNGPPGTLAKNVEEKKFRIPVWDWEGENKLGLNIRTIEGWSIKISSYDSGVFETIPVFKVEISKAGRPSAILGRDFSGTGESVLHASLPILESGTLTLVCRIFPDKK